MRSKVLTSIYLTSEQIERLRLLSVRTRVPVSSYIREGIDLVLARYDVDDHDNSNVRRHEGETHAIERTWKSST